MILPDAPFLYPILDDSFSTDLIQDAQDLIRAGVRIFQIRAKKTNNFELSKIVSALNPVCADSGTLMIINDRVDVCMVLEASGVHLGQQDFPVAEARLLLPDKLIGVSTHTQIQVKAAIKLPADYIAVGPIYPTSTKKDAEPAAGLELIGYAASISQKPIVAIGGIREQNFDEVISAGASGIALISSLYIGRNIYETAKNLIGMLRQ